MWRAETYASKQGIENHVLVPCEACGRETRADSLTAPTGLGNAKHTSGWRANAKWACGDCRERLRLVGDVSREALFKALGAPAADVARAKERDRAERIAIGKEPPTVARNASSR